MIGTFVLKLQPIYAE